MFGVILASFGTFFEEVATLIGKKEVAARKESVYTMGFLNLFWVALAFLLIAIFVPGSFRLSISSLPTLLIRAVLEIAQAYVTLRAIVSASRSTFSFIRTLTIPLLLAVDVALHYAIGTYQFIGIAIIIVTLVLLFSNHGIERKGAGLALFTAVNAVVTLSLYKYHLANFNSVIAEQLIMFAVLMVYFLIAAHFFARENPLRFLAKPIFLLQSVGSGISAGVESFAYAFAPASIILAAKRSSGILWAILSGNRYFHEKHFLMKAIGFIFLATGIVLLAL
ncbi:hypothetical protein HY477_03625 [Candidatus Uhrbacteria bacterium]|nr:hypothetical protein [Candidatus Uhrbacteria bacterium]